MAGIVELTDVRWKMMFIYDFTRSFVCFYWNIGNDRVILEITQLFRYSLFGNFKENDKNLKY